MKEHWTAHMTKYNNTQLPLKMRFEIYAPDQDLDYDHDECAQMTGKFKMVQEEKGCPTSSRPAVTS